MRPYQLQQLARLLIALQILVATALLALGESSARILVLTLVVLGVSTYLTDWKKWFRLSQPLADGLALCVMLFSAVAAFRSDRQGLLVLVANLQSYLQYVLMFQAKTPRVYWQLALLSLGQVAIASTLLPGPTFGLLLLVYLLIGILGFATLLLSSESNGLGEFGWDSPPIEPAPSGDDLPASARRMVLEGNSSTVDPRWLTRSLLPTAILVCVLTTITAGSIFFVLPRWGTSSFESTSTEPLRTVGFTETVMLGELGEVINNADLVMRVTFYRGRGDRPIRLEGEPLFRGTVVTRYEGRTWTQELPSYPIPLPTEAGSTITRQRISIEPLDVPEVFHVAPAVTLEQPDRRLQLDPSSNQLIRSDEMRSRTWEFDIGTTGIRGNRQRTVLPSSRTPSQLRLNKMLQPFGGDSAEEQFPILSELATRILSERGIDPSSDRVAAARALSDHFHLSGEYVYSLDAQERDPDLDPLEDFVSQHQAGHCEYFAGALVMMLRSQGIPARMVIGFKGGEWNDVGQYYQVQQLHAHAWVEAYLEEQHIAPGDFAGEHVPSGAWLVLDPTEGTREGASNSAEGVAARLRQSIDYARVLWINYVASLNAKRQRQGIYEPLAAGVEAGMEHLTSVEVWQARLTALEESRLGKFWFWYRRHWFSWRGGLVAVGFSLFLVGAFASGKATARWLSRRGWIGRKQQHATPPVLEMYRRLEAALERLGLMREPAQTAHEFAMAAGGQLAERDEHRPLAQLPGRVVEAFYRVRFGGRTLDKPEAEAVEHALAELELALSRSR